MADGGDGTVARVDDSVVGQVHQFCAERLHDLVQRAAPKVGAADAASE